MPEDQAILFGSVTAHHALTSTLFFGTVLFTQLHPQGSSDFGAPLTASGTTGTIIIASSLGESGWAAVTEAGLGCMLDGLSDLEVVLESDERIL